MTVSRLGKNGQGRTGWRSSALIAAIPYCVVNAWLLSAFADTGTPTWALWRPLIVLNLATLTLEALVFIVLREIPKTAIATTCGMLLLLGLWPIALLVLVPVFWLRLVNELRRRRGRQPVRLPGNQWMVNGAVVSIILLAVTLIRGASTGAFWAPIQDLSAGQRPNGTHPNIYVMMVDGYPGADVLESRFGIDNSSFERDLSERGFHVASRSRSNYSKTWLTLASFFHMTYVQDLPAIRALPRTGPEQYRALGQLVNDGPAIPLLRDAGYRIVAGRSPFSEVALMNADEQLPGPTLTSFEVQLIRYSALAAVAQRTLVELGKADLDRAIDAIGDVAESRPAEPIFVFDHVFSPHPPFFFASDGTSPALGACPRTCNFYEAQVVPLGLTLGTYSTLLRQQIEYLNSRILEGVDRITAADPSAVIILFSDHATRYDLGGDPEESNHNLFAARTPGHVGVFDTDQTPVNIFPRLLNAYLATNLPLTPYRAWVSVGDPLMLEPLDGSTGHR